MTKIQIIMTVFYSLLLIILIAIIIIAINDLHRLHKEKKESRLRERLTWHLITRSVPLDLLDPRMPRENRP